MKRKLFSTKFWLGLILSIIFVYIAFQGVNYKLLWSSLQKANYIYLPLVMFFILLTFWLRALRWGWILRPIKNKIGMDSLFSATMIGFMANNLLPARAGEVIRAYTLGRRESVSKISTFATIVIERMLDFFSLLVMFFFLILCNPFPSWVKRAGWLALAGNLILLIFILLLLTYSKVVLKIIESLAMLMPDWLSQRFKNMYLSFFEGLKILGRKKDLFLILGLSFLIWLPIILTNYLLFLSFNLGIPFIAAPVLLIITAFGVALPSSPGFIGTFEFFSILALSLFQVKKEDALGLSIVLHVSHFIPVTSIGLIYFFKEYSSFREIEEE